MNTTHLAHIELLDPLRRGCPNKAQLLNKIRELLAEALKYPAETIDMTKSLTSYGLDSMDAITVLSDLEDWLEFDLPSTLFWDCENSETVADYIHVNYKNLSS